MASCALGGQIATIAQSHWRLPGCFTILASSRLRECVRMTARMASCALGGQIATIAQSHWRLPGCFTILASSRLRECVRMTARMASCALGGQIATIAQSHWRLPGCFTILASSRLRECVRMLNLPCLLALNRLAQTHRSASLLLGVGILVVRVANRLRSTRLDASARPARHLLGPAQLRRGYRRRVRAETWSFRILVELPDPLQSFQAAIVSGAPCYGSKAATIPVPCVAADAFCLPFHIPGRRLPRPAPPRTPWPIIAIKWYLI
jgi:hypothetical protein